MIDLTNPLILFPILAIIVICIAVAKGAKNPYIMIGVLALNIVVLLLHFLQITSIEAEFENKLYYSIAIDFSIILISFLSYLWIDNVRAKAKGSKTIEDGISWFWDKI